jgi:hypothetical protein
MSQYQQFIFDSYAFDRDTGVLELHYAIDDAYEFTETYRFDFPFVDYDVAVLDRAIQLLFFIAGVSYYKTYIPAEIVVRSGQIDAATASFLSQTYQKGLGEFWYINHMDPRTTVVFPVNTDELPVLAPAQTPEGLLVGIGGGKDSLITVEALRSQQNDITTWSLNHRHLLEPLIARIGTDHAWVERTWDPQLATLKDKGAYNGHVPISAIFAAAGTIVSVLTGRRDNIVSNEQSANEPTLNYDGVSINHQYSKSQEFERLYQTQLLHSFSESYRYYSYLRSITEMRIAELFARTAYDTYKDVFSSCNRAYVHGSQKLFWCGECSKCAFVFLIFTPFLPREELERLWHDKNLLLTPELEPTYRRLLGIEGDKPLDCVGEVKESRAAMRKAFEVYPELSAKYAFELPDDYDFRAIATNEIPADISTDILEK